MLLLYIFERFWQKKVSFCKRELGWRQRKALWCLHSLGSQLILSTFNCTCVFNENWDVDTRTIRPDKKGWRTPLPKCLYWEKYNSNIFHDYLGIKLVECWPKGGLREAWTTLWAWEWYKIIWKPGKKWESSSVKSSSFLSSIIFC